MSLQKRQGPLSDLTIIDCTMAYAGPFGTVLLADLGANVIKVEPPRGDGFRMVAPFPPDYEHAYKSSKTDQEKSASADFGMSFAGVNRNKRSISLDLKNAGDKEILLQLCEGADAVVENMRSGVMDSLGLSFETILQRNPKIVYGAVRGYGDPRTGESPYADWPALDPVGQSAGGLVEATGDQWGVAIADIYPGTLMALGLLAAVHRAQQTGKGEFFDVAMYDGALTLLKSAVPAYSLTGKSGGGRKSPLVPFGLFPTTDGQVSIAAPVERHWRTLCEAMNRSDLIEDERTRSNLKRVANREFTDTQVSDWTRTLTKAQVQQALGGQVPCGPANSMEEIFNDPHVEARGMLQSAPMPGNNPDVTYAASPIKFAGQPTSLYQAPPRLDEHAESILAEFGITQLTQRQRRNQQDPSEDSQ